MPYSFYDYVETRIDDSGYSGLKVDKEGDVVTLSEYRRVYAKKEDANGGKKYLFRRRVPLLKVDVKTKELLFQTDWRKYNRVAYAYYVSKFLSATVSGAYGWYRGRVQSKAHIQEAERVAEARRVARLGKQGEYFKACRSPIVLQRFGVHLRFGDYRQVELNQARCLMSIPDVEDGVEEMAVGTRTMYAKQPDGSDDWETPLGEEKYTYVSRTTTGRHTVLTHLETFPDGEDWQFRAKLVVYDEDNTVHRTYLVGRDPTNQLWVHRVLNCFVRSSIASADKWLCWGHKDSLLVAAT